jgi:hypothetical protein
LFAPQAGFSQVDVSAIVTRLQNADTSDDAVKEIESGDSELKTAIADKLSSLMSNEKNYTVLRNESKLAGDLKVISCIPSLVNIFVNGDAIPMGTTSTMRWHMVDDPAGHALAQIGDPVIPDMQKLLMSNQSDNRVKAIRVLGNINSPAAKKVIQEHRASESDQRLQYMIDKLTTPQ